MLCGGAGRSLHAGRLGETTSHPLQWPSGGHRRMGCSKPVVPAPPKSELLALGGVQVADTSQGAEVSGSCARVMVAGTGDGQMVWWWEVYPTVVVKKELSWKATLALFTFQPSLMVRRWGGGDSDQNTPTDSGGILWLGGYMRG